MRQGNNILLDIYFQGILEAVALTPPPFAYKLMYPTGHLFRDWHSYPSWFEPGVLMKASRNLRQADVLPPSRVEATIKEYLRFESRLVVENVWIRKRNTRNILKAFFYHDVMRLQEYLKNGPYVIVTAHTSALYLLVTLFDAIGHTSPFVCKNSMKQPWNSATPLQHSVIKTMEAWASYQPFFFVGDGDVVEKGREAIRSGQSVVVPQDVLGYFDRGVQITMFGKELWSPVGAAKLAWDTGVSMLLTVARASNCFEAYRLFLKEIRPTGRFASDVQSLCKGIEESVRPNPSCWGGWLYFDKMAEG
jgi:lauroyl/myristoyl acyltransferase